MSSSSTTPTTPLSQVQFTEDDFQSPSQFVQLLNTILANHAQMLNQLLGYGGPVKFNSHIDLGGNRILNLGVPTSPTDAVSQSFTAANYSAPVLRKQFEAAGNAPLQSYRRVSDRNQREQFSTFLNDITNTAPTSNTSQVTFGAPSGGFVPVTVSSGTFQRVDGTLVNYAAYNDSLAVPASYSLTSLTRASNVVTGVTTVANTIQVGDTVLIAGATDSTYDGYFTVLTASSPNFTYAQVGAGGSTTGGTVSRFGVYYYTIKARSSVLYRYPGAFPADTWTNRVNASGDGETIVAVATVNATGGDTVNSAAGGTNPTTNIGAGVRLFGRL